MGVPAFGSFSYTTQPSYASDPSKAADVRKLLAELQLPEVESSLELFGWLRRRFVPSCHTLEPIDDAQTQFVGFLKHSTLDGTAHANRDCVVVYLGSGSVPQKTVEHVVATAFAHTEIDVYVAGAHEHRQDGRVHFAPRFDFSELLPRARCFVHHGGQNSTMDALIYGTPQVIVPGRVFERIYNAQSIERAGAGLATEHFTADGLASAVRRVEEEGSFTEATDRLRAELASLGGADAIVEEVEGHLVR
jgi:UDP:flavonoid glycosyltransferase YjiC (YdhE family)